nr:asparagine synthase-related protein [uncultured Rhodoferax sp.]
MSGFFGELNFAGESQPRPEDMARMGQAAINWGAQSGVWQENGVAIGARLRCMSAEVAFEVQPLVQHDMVLVGHIRLDDRAGLARTLGLDAAQGSQLPDSQLFALAWRRWGAACAQQVNGDWVCAIWDRQAQSLWLGRDAAGNSGLYYWQDGRRLVFSTSLKAMLAHPAVPMQANAYAIARQLTVVMDQADENSTPYLGIHRLPGGHALHGNRQGLRLDAWWQPERLVELDWPGEDRYHEAFRALYSQAVADRLRKNAGPVALMMSAGLDSGSVAALAAPKLAKHGEALLAYVAVPRFDAEGAASQRLGDEGPLACAAAEHIGNIKFHAVNSAGVGIVSSIARMLDVHDRPGHAACNQYWMQDILQQAASSGANVLLTGQGGNATVSWTGTGAIWPDLRAGRLESLMATLQGGMWPLLKNHFLKPVLRPLRQQVRRWQLPGTMPWAAYAAIHPGLVAETNLYQRMRQAGHDPAFISPGGARHPKIARFRLCQLGAASLGSTWMEAGAAYGLDVRDPTRDRRVIEFCWRVPDRIFWAGGIQRGLIRKAMPDCLPPQVLHSRHKGLQAADIGYRVLAERDAIESALRQLEHHPLANAWLDVPKMRAVLTALGHGVTPATTQQTVSILLRGLGVGLFLTRF